MHSILRALDVGMCVPSPGFIAISIVPNAAMSFATEICWTVQSEHLSTQLLFAIVTYNVMGR